MGEKFFSSKEAAEITGCTLRQLQYWREKGVIVPPISATGTGRSVYYSFSDLVELALMEYLLSLGLNFETAQQILKQLKDFEPEWTKPKNAKRVMLVWDSSEKLLRLEKFDRDNAIVSLERGNPVIPLWLDLIYQHLERKSNQ